MNIIHDTIVDGDGFRNTVYCSKCNVFCKGCHNPQSWILENGTPMTINQIFQNLTSDNNDITFSGGECSLQNKAFCKLAKMLKQAKKNIWMYSGHKYEELIQDVDNLKLLQHIDVLVDGRFCENLKDEGLLFRGSSNQRLIDIQETLNTGQVVLWNE